MKRLQFRKCTSFFILMSCLLVLHGSLNASALCCDTGRQIANDLDTCCICCGSPSTPTAKTNVNPLSTLTAHSISGHCGLCYDIPISSSPDKCYISSQDTLSHLQASMVVFNTSTFEEIVSESFPPQLPPAVNYMLTSISTVVLLI